MHNNWATPKKFYDGLNDEFHFDRDPCPLFAKENGSDGLDENIPWGKCNFVNPPYSRKEKEAFVLRAVEEKKNGNTSVLLLPVSTSTKLFHEIIFPNADEVRYVRGRLNFLENGIEGKKTYAMKDSMLVVFRGVK